MAADLLQAALQHLQELHLVPQGWPPECAAQNAPEGSEHSAAGGRPPKVPPRACARYARWFYACAELVLPCATTFLVPKARAIGFLRKQRRVKLLPVLRACVYRTEHLV